MTRPVELVIFDLDDTIIHANLNYRQLRYELAKFFDPPQTQEEVEGKPLLRILEILKEKNPERYIEAYNFLVNSERKAAEKARLIKGAEDEIPRVIKKYALKSAIYTNNSSSTLKLYLRRFKFLEEFYILTRDDIINPKPDPEGLIKILQSLNVKNEKALYFGDSWIDASAADKAKIKFVLFDSRNIDRSTFPQKEYDILKNWSEFEPYILKLFQTKA
ncbi:MAG: HAD family hydrolase [Candidatus Hodarchaeales archaeon]